MVTILVSGSGTGVGKTRVTAALARLAARHGCAVQIVKPVQTGLAPGKPSDADDAAVLAGIDRKQAHTLRRYPAALAPMAAAKASGFDLNILGVLADISQLQNADVRLVEGAGGLAVPLADSLLSGEHGEMDWMDFAIFIKADAVVLVVSDELGAINQGRLVYSYFSAQNRWTNFPKLNGGVFLNALREPPPEVAASTRATLVDCQVPVWGELAANAIEPRIQPPLAELLRKK